MSTLNRVGLIQAILALSCPIDPEVKFVLANPAPGSNAWPQLNLNEHYYAKLPSQTASEARSLAGLIIMGKAAELILNNRNHGLVARTFYKNQKNELVPKLHIAIPPEASQTASTTMDTNAELAQVSAALAKHGYNFEGIPAAVAATPAVLLGYLNTKLSAYNTGAAKEEMAKEESADAPPEL